MSKFLSSIRAFTIFDSNISLYLTHITKDLSVVKM